MKSMMYSYVLAHMSQHFHTTTRDLWIVVFYKLMDKSDPIWNCWAGLALNAYLLAIAAPIEETRSVLPIGVQIVPCNMGDKTSLAASKILEQHHRSFVSSPNFV